MSTNNLNTITIGNWSVTSHVGSLPELFNHYFENATFVDNIDFYNSDFEGCCFFAISDTAEADQEAWPEVVITMRYSPQGSGFHPGLLIVPDTQVLFIGAGTTLIAYDLQKRERLWEDYTYCGFWRWEYHQETVIMSGELEIVAWDKKGEKLWTKAVEPPWHYKIKNSKIELDVMGKKTSFDIYSGT